MTKQNFKYKIIFVLTIILLTIVMCVIFKGNEKETADIINQSNINKNGIVDVIRAILQDFIDSFLSFLENYFAEKPEEPPREGPKLHGLAGDPERSKDRDYVNIMNEIKLLYFPPETFERAFDDKGNIIGMADIPVVDQLGVPDENAGKPVSQRNKLIPPFPRLQRIDFPHHYPGENITDYDFVLPKHYKEDLNREQQVDMLTKKWEWLVRDYIKDRFDNCQNYYRYKRHLIDATELAIEKEKREYPERYITIYEDVPKKSVVNGSSNSSGASSFFLGNRRLNLFGMREIPSVTVVETVREAKVIRDPTLKPLEVDFPEVRRYEYGYRKSELEEIPYPYTRFMQADYPRFVEMSKIQPMSYGERKLYKDFFNLCLEHKPPVNPRKLSLLTSPIDPIDKTWYYNILRRDYPLGTEKGFFKDIFGHTWYDVEKERFVSKVTAIRKAQNFLEKTEISKLEYDKINKIIDKIPNFRKEFEKNFRDGVD